MFHLDELRSRFEARFGRSPRIFSAPGRVNLIGEHTDYNDGFALPMAIDRRTYVLAAARQDTTVVARTENLDEEFEFDLAQPGQAKRGAWSDYVEGVARMLREAGVPLHGADLSIASDVPAGAGLSASAALELGVGLALATVSGTDAPDPVLLARAGQRAEHVYVGTLCGIMDQYVSALGRAEHALLIDFRSLHTELVPFAFSDAVLVVCDTRVKHALASSAYNERRRECEEGVSRLSSKLPGIRALRDVSVEALAQQRGLLSDTVFRRCRHVVSENARTVEAAQVLARGDLERFGILMNESHASLREDYEVSCAELDRAVELAQADPDVYGSRMTGGGFGGCTVTLCRSAAAERVSRGIARGFEETFGVRPELFVTRACDGMRAHTDV